jgi:hypothetical protein
MRRIVAIVTLGASFFALAACSNTGGNSFVPSSQRSVNEGSVHV